MFNDLEFSPVWLSELSSQQYNIKHEKIKETQLSFSVFVLLNLSIFGNIGLPFLTNMGMSYVAVPICPCKYFKNTSTNCCLCYIITAGVN